MKAYCVHYIMSKTGDEKQIAFLAKNKVDAYDKAVYELIPEITGEPPYAAWVQSVTYNNGNYRAFNTCAGKPY